MEYKGLSHQELCDLKADGLTEAQIEKENKRVSLSFSEYDYSMSYRKLALHVIHSSMRPIA